MSPGTIRIINQSGIVPYLPGAAAFRRTKRLTGYEFQKSLRLFIMLQEKVGISHWNRIDVLIRRKGLFFFFFQKQLRRHGLSVFSL